MNSLFKKICIASDHAGFNLKEDIKNHLINKKLSIFDLGPLDKKSVDYPDYAKKLANRIKLKKVILVYLFVDLEQEWLLVLIKSKLSELLFVIMLSLLDCLDSIIMLI